VLLVRGLAVITQFKDVDEDREAGLHLAWGVLEFVPVADAFEDRMTDRASHHPTSEPPDGARSPRPDLRSHRSTLAVSRASSRPRYSTSATPRHPDRPSLVPAADSACLPSATLPQPWGVNRCRTPRRRRGSGTVARVSARSRRSPSVAGTRPVAVLRTWPDSTADTAGMGEDVIAGVAFW
jgi:hypothetical protein